MHVLELCQYLMISSLRDKWEREILTSWPLKKLIKMYQKIEKLECMGIDEFHEALFTRIRDYTKEAVKKGTHKTLGQLHFLTGNQKNDIFSNISWHITDLKMLKCQSHPFSIDQFILANVNRLEVNQDFEILMKLLKCFKNLTHLELRSNPVQELALLIANSANLHTLRQLSLSHSDFDNNGVMAIAQSQHLKNLEVLEIYCSRITDIGISVLVESPNVKHLMHLDLSGNKIGTKGLQSIAESKYLKNLKKLNLNYIKLLDSDIKIIGSSENLSNLTELGLSHTSMSDKAAIVLAQSKYLQNLKHLYLRNNQIGAQGIEAITRSPFLKNLHELNLIQNKFGNQGVKMIAASENLSSLKILRLGYNHISLEGVRELAKAPFLKNVVELGLQVNDLCDLSVKELANSKDLVSLKILHLSSNQIGPEGAKALDSPNFSLLEELRLGCNYLGDKGVEIIAKSSQMLNLKVLDVIQNGISPLGARALLDSEFAKQLKELDIGEDDLVDDLVQL